MPNSVSLEIWEKICQHHIMLRRTPFLLIYVSFGFILLLLDALFDE